MQAQHVYLAVLLTTATPLPALAITCPSTPDVAGRSSAISSDVRVAVGSLGKIKLGDLSVKTNVVAKSIFEKFPNIDELVKIQMMSSTYCQLLNESKSLSDQERLKRWEEFQRSILKLQGSPSSSGSSQKSPTGISLKGSYPGEIWKVAQAADFSWLTDKWCYPSLPGFVTYFRVERGRLFRQNESGPPRAFKTDWIPVEQVHMSNRDVLRISYPRSQDWPIDFIQFEQGRTAEWREYQRSIKDDGTVQSSAKKLVLSCTRCTLDPQGITYDCKR